MLSYAQFMAQGNKTVEEIIAFKKLLTRQLHNPTPEQKTEEPSYQVTVKNLVIPSEPGNGAPALTDARVKELLGDINAFGFIESIRTVDAKGKEGLVKNMSQLYTTGCVMNLAGTKITECMARKGLEGDHQDFKLVTKDLHTYYYGGGTLQGLLERMKVGHGKVGTKYVDPVVSADEFEFIKRHLPVDSSKLITLKGKVPSDCSPRMNEMAHAGAPYFDPAVRVFDKIEEIAEKAKMLYDLAAEHYLSLKNYLGTISRADGVVILKNKRELSKRSNLYTKVRPYYVFPGALRLLWSCFIDSYSDALQNYWENEESISAFRFSWVHGGAQRLSDFVENCMKKGKGFYPLSWGDDQFWVVVCGNGETMLFALDIVAMDMSIHANTAKAFTKSILEAYGDKSDAVWNRLIIHHGQYITRHQTLMHRAIVMEKTDGVSSGIHGTSHVDFVGSARVIYRAKPLMSECKTGDDAVIRMKQVVKILESELGMRVKPGTEIGAVYDQKTRLLPVPFLGMTTGIVEIDGFKAVVPIPDIPKLSAAMFYSAESNHDANRIRALMTKCVGICASGGYTNLLLYHVCRRVYDFYKLDHQPENSYVWLSGIGPSEVSEFLDHSKCVKAKDFPTRRWFMNLYLPEDQLTMNITNVTNSDDDGGLNETEAELLDHVSLFDKKMKWADIDRVLPREATGPEVTIQNAPEPPIVRVPAAKAGLFPPDKAKRAAKLERMEKRSALRHQEKLARWAEQRANRQRKWKGKCQEELEMEDDYEEDRIAAEEEEMAETEAAYERTKDEERYAQHLAEMEAYAEEYDLQRYKRGLEELEFDEAEEDLDDYESKWEAFYGDGFGEGMAKEDS